MNTSEIAGQQLDRLQRTAILLGVVGLALCVVGAVVNGARVYESYLFAYLFWLGVSAGSLALLMLHHVTGGGWGYILRRLFEASVRLLPVMGLLLIPVLLGMSHLFEWTHPSETEVRDARGGYLNVPFFILRAVLYFVIWTALGTYLSRWSRRLEERRDLDAAARLNVVGALGLVVYVLTITFATFDWVMSLTPHWFSSIIGLIFVAGQGLSAMSLSLVLLAYLAGRHPLIREIPSRYFRDLGNILLTLVLLWAYLSFSQYLIIYAGNVSEESIWYVDRRQSGWGWIGLLLIPLHFALPFLVLLVGSGIKRDPVRLARVAAFIVLMRFLDLFWWVVPTFRDQTLPLLSDFGAPLLIGGVWLWLWVGQMRGRALVPEHDPRLEGHWPLQEAARHG